MTLFTSLAGVNITPKRDMVSETISNNFIVMHSDVHNTCYCTSEPVDLVTLGDLSVNSLVQTLLLMWRRKIVACKLCLKGDYLLLVNNSRDIKKCFLTSFSMVQKCKD